jgi:hypothetical protein
MNDYLSFLTNGFYANILLSDPDVSDLSLAISMLQSINIIRAGG